MIMRTKIRERSFDRQNSQTWIRYGKYAATEIFATTQRGSSKSIFHFFNASTKKVDYWQKNDGTLQQHSIKIQNWFLSAAPHHPAC